MSFYTSFSQQSPVIIQLLFLLSCNQTLGSKELQWETDIYFTLSFNSPPFPSLRHYTNFRFQWPINRRKDNKHKRQNLKRGLYVSSLPSRPVIYHDFRDLNIFHSIFGFESQIMTLSQKFQKSDFLGHCSFTQLFHDVEKLMRKPKIFVMVIRRILVCTTCGLNIFKNPPEAVKVATWVKFFNVEKT